jgi:predicted transcriptional regulator
MGLSKTDLFSGRQNELANIAKALSNPARIAILEHLLKSNSCINSDLVTELGLAQATISQHLKELKSIGFIQGTIEGTSMNYCINKQNWLQTKELLCDLFDQADSCKTGDCC